LSPDRKTIRAIVGFTFSRHGGDPENWYSLACSFNEAATLINAHSKGSTSAPYHYNAALSIELMLKAITLSKGQSLQENHNLIGQAKNSGINFTDDQLCTLELFSEVIIWSGRYPRPKSEEFWDKYYDEILEKHIIREAFRTSINRNRFPIFENYQKIWEKCEDVYKSAQSGAT
jgi:hypothetical protein